MIRFVLRSLGLWIFAAGFVLFIYDGTRSLAGSKIVFYPAGQLWADIHSTSLQLLQAAVERHVSDALWQYVIQPVLEQPSWVVLGVIGALLILLGRKKKPLIGYARH